MALTNKLTAIANAIRAKTGGTEELTLDEMVDEIEGISGGGEPVIESKTITANGTYTAPTGVDGYSPVVVNVPSSFPQITFSGTLGYLNYNGQYNWLFENYANYINIVNITNANNMFDSSTLEDLSSLTLNFNDALFSDFPCSYLFAKNNNLKKLPKIGNNSVKFESARNLFQGCDMLREIGNEWSTKVSFTVNSNNKSQMFYGCGSLREVPQTWLTSIDATGTTNIYPQMFSSCYSLDEITNLNPINVGYTANQFSSTFYNNCRIKNITFKTNNGIPYVTSWKKQTIDLTSFMGWAPNQSWIIGKNNGITADKEVNDAASYEALKNDPDWFATNIAYSRYNHDSAVATINSLPDTSAVATGSNINTIKFKGDAGSATDGGAINTLTAAEIAVATNKGWTVTLV